MNRHERRRAARERQRGLVVQCRSRFAAQRELARRAGIAEQHMVIGTAADEPWSVDDRRWFEANPARSHRLRRPFEGELSSLMRQPEQPPPHHEMQVLVRQIEPGLRARRISPGPEGPGPPTTSPSCTRSVT